MADVTMDGEGMYGTVEEGVSWEVDVVMMHSDGEWRGRDDRGY